MNTNETIKKTPKKSSFNFTLDGKKIDIDKLKKDNKVFIEKNQPENTTNTYNEELDNIKNIAIL